MAEIIALRDHIPETRFAHAAHQLHEALLVTLATGETKDFEPTLADARALIHLAGLDYYTPDDIHAEAASAVLTLRAGASLAATAP